ncbi:MAG TPA: tetratricopeptide repeat protein [Candidatus Obscuribacterales bacterium]
MDIKFTTTSVDIQVALKAHHLYKQGLYTEAIPILLDILDTEPANHYARLYLGVCYFKTNQSLAALRALKFVYDKSDIPEIKTKARMALQIINADVVDKTNKIPLEFGNMRSQKSLYPPIESLIQ